MAETPLLSPGLHDSEEERSDSEDLLLIEEEEEDEDCTFVAEPKYKKLKVFHIRDFPEGCGCFASSYDPKAFAQSNDSNLKLIDEDLEDTDELTSAAKDVKCDSSNVSESSSTEVVFAGDSSSDVNIAGSSACLKKVVNRRVFSHKVEAVRDFPPFCGPNALEVDLFSAETV